MKVVCIDGEPQYRSLVERDVVPTLEQAGHTLDWFEERLADQDAVIARASGYDAIYVVGDQGPLPDGIFRANPQIRLVSFVGTGARRFVPMAEAAECQVIVTNVSDFASQSVAELAVALMFAVARRLGEGQKVVREGPWEKRPGIKLAGSRLGVVGAGAIGRRVIELGRGLGMDVVYWNRTHSQDRDREVGARYMELAELFATSTVVSIHLSHTPETDRFVSRGLLEMMSATSILVNTARAEVLDNVALGELLDRGAIFGAGLDVFDTEPPSPEQLPAPQLNVVLTPHIGFYTDEADDVFRLAADNIIAFASGEPTNVITTEP